MSSELVPRPRAERVLRSAVEQTPLTLLMAPLGAGKTSVARAAFSNGAVWMDARPWHREAFVGDVVAAVRGVRPDFGRMTLGAVEAGASPARIGATFAQELGHIDEPLTIVVDDVQIFSGEAAFARFVDAAIGALPPAVHIVAMGRSLPEMTLGKNFIRSRAQVLDGAFLAFDADDVAAFGRSLGRELGAEEIADVLRSTEGWGAGVVLAVTARHVPVPASSGPRGAAEAYLTTELLARLDRDALAFLERTSVFESLDLHVLECSPAFAGARDAISALRRRGAPIAQVGNGTYRMHPVLRELAESRLRKRGDSGAHRDAAGAYAAAGEIAAALFHADRSGDDAFAAAFLRTHAEAAIATGDRVRARTVAARIDVEGPDADVRWYVEALLEKARGSAGVRATLSHAAAAADASNDDAIAFAARAQIVQYDLGHLERIEPDALEDLSRRAAALDAPAIAAVSVMRGWSRAIERDFAGALAETAALAGSTDPAVRFNADVLRAYAHTALGDAEGAQETLDALMRRLESDDRVVMLTLTLVWFARLALVWGHTNAAADAAAQAERFASALDLRAEEAALYAALAEVSSHAGDVDATVRYAERARGRADRAWYAGDVGRVRAFAEIALARAAFLGHDNAIARELAERLIEKSYVPPVQRAVATTEAAFYTLLCEPQASAATIERAKDALRAASPRDAADAAALATADDLLAFLDAANGITHVPLVAGCEPFGTLLERRRGLVTLEHAGIAAGNARRGTTGSSAAFDAAIERLTRDGPRFEARLARAYAASFVKPKGPSARNVPDFDLTPREAEILVLLADGLTNKEIAQRLVVSPRTIETHVERVLGKLEVGSRSRAIAKAIRLGLVALD